MLSNCRMNALAAVRHAQSATISVRQANPVHCLPAQHHGLGTGVADLGGSDARPSSQRPSVRPQDTADYPPRGTAARLRKAKRLLTRGTDVPGAVWAALVLNRTMCS